MAVDLAYKVAHLIRDFRAVLQLVEFIEHELEKRIVARLGLIKIEALDGILAAYKNEIKRNLGVKSRNKVAVLEGLLTQLRKDVKTGIRDARNAQAGHSLGLQIHQIPDHWLFMGHTSFSILEQDLIQVETQLRGLDRAYQSAIISPPLDPNLLSLWASPKMLGLPSSIRFAQVYAGPWTPDVVSALPGNTTFQDATLRVLGLRLMMRQVGFLVSPFWQSGGAVELWERLLVELSMIDFFALEEAVYDGNAQGNTKSLIDEWLAENPPQKGIAILRNGRLTLNSARTVWRDQIRNKVCAHMDLNVSKAMLDVANWPLALPDLYRDIECLCRLIGDAALLDIRTRFFTSPVTPLQNAISLAGTGAPRWMNT